MIDEKAREAAVTALEPKCRSFTGGANPLARRLAEELADAAIIAYESANQKGEAEGWVLVPREPTNAMLWANAGTSDTHKPTWNRAMWAAFLAAAPEPPTMLSAGGEG